MKVIEVKHPTLGNVCIMAEDIDKFGVPLEIVPPVTKQVMGKTISFSPSIRYQSVEIDGRLSRRVYDTHEPKSLLLAVMRGPDA